MSLSPYDNLGVAIVMVIAALFMQPLEFAVPTYLLAADQPRREHHVRRCVVAFLGLVGFNLATSMVVWAAMALPPTSPVRYAANTVVYALYLFALVIAVRHVFEMNVWNALFCATAGYTIQNLGSGTGELARLLVETSLGTRLGDVGIVACSDTSIICVIVLCYIIYIRHARRIGRLGDDARNMLGMLVLVIMVVIEFDVVIRGLERGGAQVGFLLALRVVHVAVCMFVLYAEGEVLVNARLRTEVSTREALAVERERQYELSRETIAAVNRRVHDIRHQVLRDLSGNETQVSRDVMATVARDIAVYDTQVKTGNDVLDTILTEKGLLCHRRGVTLSCIADGTTVASLSVADLYALFGGLLDGAIDATCSQPDTSRRSVSLTLRRLGNLVLLHVEHYTGDGDGGPSTGVREIVERHGGTLTMSSADDVVTVDAMLPVGG